MRKYTAHEALIGRQTAPKSSKKGSNHHNLVIGTFFHSFQLVMSQPQDILIISKRATGIGPAT